MTRCVFVSFFIKICLHIIAWKIDEKLLEWISFTRTLVPNIRWIILRSLNKFGGRLENDEFSSGEVIFLQMNKFKETSPRKLSLENKRLEKCFTKIRFIGKQMICIEEMRRFFGAHYVGVLPRVTPSVFPALIHARIYARIESTHSPVPLLIPNTGSRTQRHTKGRKWLIAL